MDKEKKPKIDLEINKNSKLKNLNIEVENGETTKSDIELQQNIDIEQNIELNQYTETKVNELSEKKIISESDEPSEENEEVESDEPSEGNEKSESDEPSEENEEAESDEPSEENEESDEPSEENKESDEPSEQNEEPKSDEPKSDEPSEQNEEPKLDEPKSDEPSEQNEEPKLDEPSKQNEEPKSDEPSEQNEKSGTNDSPTKKKNSDGDDNLNNNQHNHKNLDNSSDDNLGNKLDNAKKPQGADTTKVANEGAKKAAEGTAAEGTVAGGAAAGGAAGGAAAGGAAAGGAAAAGGPYVWAAIAIVAVVVLFIILVTVLMLYLSTEAYAGEETGINIGSSTGGTYFELSQKCEQGVKSIAGSGIGKTWGLEEYVARVVKAELGYEDYPEALKAQAVLARTRVLDANKNRPVGEVCEIEISTNVQDADVDTKIENLTRFIQAANDTAGQVLIKDGGLISSYFSNWPNGTAGSQNWGEGGCGTISCSSGLCTTKFYKYPSKTSWNFTMPETNKNGNYWNENGGLSKGKQSGHCHGVSQLGLLYYDESGWTYDNMIKYFYDDGVEIGNYNGQNVTIVNADHSGVVTLAEGIWKRWDKANCDGRRQIAEEIGVTGDWCAIFVHHILTKANVYDSIGLNGTRDSGEEGGWTYAGHYTRGKNAVCHSPSEYNPKPGDIVVIDWPEIVGKKDHVGIVIEDYGDRFLSIEGNTGSDGCLGYNNTMKESVRYDAYVYCFLEW